MPNASPDRNDEKIEADKILDEDAGEEIDESDEDDDRLDAVRKDQFDQMQHFVMVDDRGRSKGEGIIEYERKPSAMDALRRCQEGVFFLTASLRPVIVELIEESEDDDGLMEKNLFKKSQEFGMEREVGSALSVKSKSARGSL